METHLAQSSRLATLYFHPHPPVVALSACQTENALPPTPETAKNLLQDLAHHERKTIYVERIQFKRGENTI